MSETSSEASTDTSDGQGPLLEEVAIGLPHRRQCQWLRLVWLLLCSRLPVCMRILGRVHVYGRARLAANILGLHLQDALDQMRSFARCASSFLTAVPRSGMVNGYRWVDPDDEDAR